MIIIHEEEVKNPNKDLDAVLDKFVKKLEEENVDIKKVSYRNKTIFVSNKEDYEYVTALLDHDYKEEKKLGVRVAMDIEPGVNLDIPDPVIANEDIDKTDDTEEILLENEPDYPEEQIKDALQVLGYTVKGYEYDGRLITKYGKSGTVYFDDWADAQDFILNMYTNNKTDKEYKWAYDVLVGNKTFDDYWESDNLKTESIMVNGEEVLDTDIAAIQSADAAKDNIYQGILDFEIEISSDIDNNKFWNKFRSEMNKRGIGYKIDGKDTEWDDHYYYMYIWDKDIDNNRRR